MKRFSTFLLLTFSVVCFAQGPLSKNGLPQHRVERPETPHLVFVTEYIRELAALDRLRTSSEKNLKQDTTDEVFSNVIYDCTRMQYELKTRINMLKDMHLNPPFEKLIPTLTNSYTDEVESFQKLIGFSSAMIGGPKPGVDYAKITAETPKVRARLEYIDHGLFETVTPVVFLTLVDRKADSHNQASHLIITRAERAQLLDEINTDFGSKLDQKDPSYEVGAAVILKAGLLKDQPSDDPWE